MELGVLRFEDDTHASLSDLFYYAVVKQSFPNHRHDPNALFDCDYTLARTMGNRGWPASMRINLRICRCNPHCDIALNSTCSRATGRTTMAGCDQPKDHERITLQDEFSDAPHDAVTCHFILLHDLLGSNGFFGSGPHEWNEPVIRHATDG